MYLFDILIVTKVLPTIFDHYIQLAISFIVGQRKELAFEGLVTLTLRV
jgi:hypothetical protein